MARGKVASHVTGRRHQAREGAPGVVLSWLREQPAGHVRRDPRPRSADLHAFVTSAQTT
jgi:hypothetical protein